MPSITLTVTAAEATRITNAATALGYPDGKSLIVALVKQAVSAQEQQANAQQFSTAYTPVAPT